MNITRTQQLLSLAKAQAAANRSSLLQRETNRKLVEKATSVPIPPK